MMSLSPDMSGHHSSEPMTMGTPTSPTSPVNQSQYLPSYLLGDSMSHAVSPMSSRLWSSASGSPPRSAHRASSLVSPNSSGFQQYSTPRLETSMRGKDKVGAPPIRSLLQSSSPPGSQSFTNSPFSTPSQYPTRTPGLSTPAPPTTGLSQTRHDSMFSPDNSSYMSARFPTSPAQLDPFYTQGENLTPDDILDDTWVTVFGFPSAAVSFVLQQFSQYGNILKHVISTEGNWMHIHYQSKIQAKKALSKNGKVIGHNIMVGVSPCIDKKVMECDKENESTNTSFNPGFATPNSSMMSNTPSQSKGTPIRPLTAAYKAARSEHEVMQNNQAARKNSGFVSKAMEYMFGW